MLEVSAYLFNSLFVQRYYEHRLLNILMFMKVILVSLKFDASNRFSSKQNSTKRMKKLQRVIVIKRVVTYICWLSFSQSFAYVPPDTGFLELVTNVAAQPNKYIPKTTMNIASVDSLQSNAQFNLRLVQFVQKKRVDIYLDCEEFFYPYHAPSGSIL